MDEYNNSVGVSRSDYEKWRQEDVRRRANLVEEVIQRSAFGKQYGKWSKEVRQLTEEVCEVLGIKQ
jgi:hypothetical protein